MTFIFSGGEVYDVKLTFCESSKHCSSATCVVSSSHDGISAAEVELRVRPGDNVTLYCDCIITTGVYIMWYRNCSQKYQPPLVISTKFLSSISLPGCHVVWNPSNNSYDLLIENITESDLGLYYCGTVETNLVGEGKPFIRKELYHYGNITTRISFETSPPEHSSSPPLPEDCDDVRTPDVDCGLCWMLLFSLCPVSALLPPLLHLRLLLLQTTAPAETPPGEVTAESRLQSKWVL
eukprot:XP_014041334.1 PREDICTED: uncharacterized protein LOC106594490 isoform X2 [Salmo salar]